VRRVALLLLALAVTPAAARADDKAATEATAQAVEAKAMLQLLRAAVKERFPRQAWYCATRLAAIDPKNAEAKSALSDLDPKRLPADEGLAPSKSFLEKRFSVLSPVGDAYEDAARALELVGGKAEDVTRLRGRAMAFHSKSTEPETALANAGRTWAGAWGAVPTADFDKAFGNARREVSFPPEYDDAFLAVRCLVPNAKIVELGAWRLVTEEPLDAAARRIRLLVDVDVFVADLVKGAARPPKEGPKPTDVVVVADPAVYEALGEAWKAFDPKAPSDPSNRFPGSSGWDWVWQHRVLALSKPRVNPWIGDDAPMLFHAGRSAIYARLALGGRATGRGTWIVDGLAGAIESFSPPTAQAPKGTVVPAKCWRVHAAKAFKGAKQLVPWADLFEVDRRAQNLRERGEATFRFGGADRKAEGVDVVAAQATAFVWALLDSGGGKNANKVGTLVADTLVRDRLPDVDKAMGWAKGAAVQEVEKFLDGLRAD
jgi:hypothetical protein